MLALPDHKLSEFVTQTDASERKWLALHILEMKRNERLAEAAQSSARAAWIAAAIAGVSAVVAILAYSHRPT